MKHAKRWLGAVVGGTVLFGASCAMAQDWPQWRGANRDGKATFTAPATWPKQLTQKWKVTVGQGDGPVALVGNNVYAFARQDADEVIRCLNAADGKEVWAVKYPVAAISGPDANQHMGPRTSPAVADGKVVTLGVTGILTCTNAADGKPLWKNDTFKGTPRFHTASSPLILDGMAIAQLGGASDGAVVAFDLTSGTQKWKWTGECPGYASPVVMTVDGAKVLIVQSDKSILAINAADGKEMWKVPFAPQGMGYNASTPVVNGQTLIYAGQGRGVHAVKFTKEGDKLAAKELWSNADNSVQFNSPVLKDGLLYGITQQGQLFCLNAETGKANWTAPLAPAGGRMGAGGQPIMAAQMGGGGMGGGMGGGRRGGGRGGMGGASGYGSLVDAGSVLMALTPASDLVVFQPSDKQFTEVARIKVAASPVYAYPVVSGNRILVKDADSVALLTVE